MKMWLFKIGIGLGMAGYSGPIFSSGTQHGFVLYEGDRMASHLVAGGHHSRQVEIEGELTIPDPSAAATYLERKANREVNKSYFLLQAQNLDLAELVNGQVLVGHIVESKVGEYSPKNIIVKSATFRIQRVLLNMLNPFFINDH